MSGSHPAAEFGSADEEIQRLVAAFTQVWAAATGGSDPVRIAAEVVARHRRGARQLTDGAVLTLVTGGLVALSEDAERDPSALDRYSGAIRLVNRYRAIVAESGGPQAFESLVPAVVEALDEERPDPQTYEALAALGLLRRWRASLG
jgi:hypothetical protein